MAGLPGSMRPQLAGRPWRPLFTPRLTGCYVNDHSVIRTRDGRWHVIGITKMTPEVGSDHERYFCHGSGPSLVHGDFAEHWKVCDWGYRAWAPTIVLDQQRYVMLFGPDIMRAAISHDDELNAWNEVPCSVAGCPPGGNLRDQMVLRLDGDTWLMYATAWREGCGAISVFVSEDLLNWRFVRYAWRTTQNVPQALWSAAESPFVFEYDGAFFLSVTYTSSLEGPQGYHNTLLFRSNNPFDFGVYSGNDGAEVCAKLPLHAPEYIREPDSGQWYVTSCGWPGEFFQAVIPGSVAITELEWVA